MSFLSGGRVLLVPALAVMLWTPVFPARPSDALARAGVPAPVVHHEASSHESPAPIPWIDDMRNALGRYMWTHPDSQLNPYLETLTLVRDAVGRGDRRTVKLEMETYFSMLVTRARGISEAAAKELFTAAVRLTPAQAYGISVPASLPQ